MAAAFDDANSQSKQGHVASWRATPAARLCERARKRGARVGRRCGTPFPPAAASPSRRLALQPSAACPAHAAPPYCAVRSSCSAATCCPPRRTRALREGRHNGLSDDQRNSGERPARARRRHVRCPARINTGRQHRAQLAAAWFDARRAKGRAAAPRGAPACSSTTYCRPCRLSVLGRILKEGMPW